MISYFDSYRLNNQLWIIMECMEGGSLLDIVEMEIVLSESQIATILFDVLSALSFIHSRNRIHGNLVEERIYLTSRGVAKIGRYLPDIYQIFARYFQIFSDNFVDFADTFCDIFGLFQQIFPIFSRYFRDIW